MAGVTVSTVLLDVDGTLLDTREFIFAAFENTLRGFELPARSRDELARLVGPPLEAIYRDIGGGNNPDAMALVHRDFQVANLQLAVAFAGAAETLVYLRDRGVRLAAVTSRSRRTSVASLEQTGLLQLLEAVVSAEDAEALKPDPRHLRAALEALAVDGNGVAMVGDTPADIAGGRNIGAFTVAALYGFHGPAVLDSHPDAGIEDIRDLPRALGL
jgi:HAD superfamily hydrolase (TIGR01509 family)